MELNSEMQAYIDGFGDGYSRGFQEALAAQANKTPIIWRGHAETSGAKGDGPAVDFGDTGSTGVGSSRDVQDM